MIRSIVCVIGFLIGADEMPNGMIEGFVQNGTRSDASTAGVDVVLRAEVNGQIGIVDQAMADDRGHFRFSGLPLGDDIVYLPGANLGDVHFPGPRVRLQLGQPQASVTLAVYEAVSAPNPLIIDEHEVTIRSQPGAITVRESLRINNPSSACWVGSPRHEGALPVTLQLGIPSGFERITFDSEAFGRQFRLIDEKLVTSLPWPPGSRALSFTYVIANPGRNGTWRRQLSLPCRHSRIAVELDQIEEARCNLPRLTTNANERVLFDSGDRPLAAGYVLELHLGELPVPIDSFARRVALSLFVALALAVSIVAFRQRSSLGRVHRIESRTFERMVRKRGG